MYVRVGEDVRTCWRRCTYVLAKMYIRVGKDVHTRWQRCTYVLAKTYIRVGKDVYTSGERGMGDSGVGEERKRTTCWCKLPSPMLVSSVRSSGACGKHWSFHVLLALHVDFLTLSGVEFVLKESEPLIGDDSDTKAVFHLPTPFHGNESLVDVCGHVWMDV